MRPDAPLRDVRAGPAATYCDCGRRGLQAAILYGPIASQVVKRYIRLQWRQGVGLTAEEFKRVSGAINMAITRVLDKGADDVFRPPIFSQSIEGAILGQKPDEFRREAFSRTLKFIQIADLQKHKIGPARRGLVTKDQNSFRQVAWLDHSMP